MPIIHAHILEGRTPEQKRALIASVTEAVATSLDANPETIRVLVHEVAKSDWGIGGQTAEMLGR